EKYSKDIKKLLSNYDKYIYIINDSNLTSDELVFNENISEIISDTSTTLINAHYIRNDIKIKTYANLLECKYNVKINTRISIFKKLREQGIIEDFSIM
uniref:polysialyltransferase family glycosyltransferase n=1 Tax=Romboutsia sp. Marseille-P6047 TaxID=2161817 RepID=UPI0013DE2080